MALSIAAQDEDDDISSHNNNINNNNTENTSVGISYNNNDSSNNNMADVGMSDMDEVMQDVSISSAENSVKSISLSEDSSEFPVIPVVPISILFIPPIMRNDMASPRRGGRDRGNNIIVGLLAERKQLMETLTNTGAAIQLRIEFAFNLNSIKNTFQLERGNAHSNSCDGILHFTDYTFAYPGVGEHSADGMCVLCNCCCRSLSDLLFLHFLFVHLVVCLFILCLVCR